LAAPRRRKRAPSAPRKAREFVQARTRLAVKIRSLRAARDLTQQETAEAAAIEVKHLQLIESGDHSNPTLATLVAVAKAFGVELHELLK
jgi:transcriptional regulator with XRE-family HTH domain